MYQSQHTIESLGTARVILRHALDYTDYLYDVLGREFVLAEPIEIRGVDRLRLKFVSASDADSERPFIEVYVEYNPAMGLYTVSGKYWTHDSIKDPTYQSSPRSGFDDEMLADPARMFDWLTAVTTGGLQSPVSMAGSAFESVADALNDLHTPAGRVEEFSFGSDDGVDYLRLATEYRMPLDYYVSGTHFSGPDDERGLLAVPLSFDDWMDSYASPVAIAVQRTLNNLYGTGAYSVDVDEEGFVYVMNNTPKLAQESKAPNRSQSFFELEVLRMAGVDGRERLDDRRLTEKKVDPDADKLVGQPKKKKSPPADKFQMMVKDGDNLAKFNQLVSKLKKHKGVKDPEALAAWIGLRVAGKRSHSGRGAAKEEANVTSALRALLAEIEDAD